VSREAASYRRRLRHAEAERDDLRGRLEGYERAEVERIARDAGFQVKPFRRLNNARSAHRPSAFWNVFLVPT
jgi:hypothetical protein